jgi:hypothetical protein
MLYALCRMPPPLHLTPCTLTKVRGARPLGEMRTRRRGERVTRREMEISMCYGICEFQQPKGAWGNPLLFPFLGRKRHIPTSSPRPGVAVSPFRRVPGSPRPFNPPPDAVVGICTSLGLKDASGGQKEFY